MVSQKADQDQSELLPATMLNGIITKKQLQKTTEMLRPVGSTHNFRQLRVETL